MEWTQLHDNKNPNIITPINHNYWGDAGGGGGRGCCAKMVGQTNIINCRVSELNK